MTNQYGHFIAGAGRSGQSGRNADVFNPSTGEVKAQVALASAAEVDEAVRSAVAAQAEWATVNPQRRARVMFQFKALVEADADNLARLLSEEHGKVIADSKGDLQRGLEVFHTCSKVNTPTAPDPVSTCSPCASPSAWRPGSRRSISRP
jgi:malonate-semialdehyde dehydrogenase (acetylating)/methylmalonate-semialdehyde dehydrogenase